MLFSSRVIYATIFYILSMTIIFLTKPTMIFNEDNTIKNFGLGEYNSLYNLGTVSVILAILCFYIFAFIDYMYLPIQL
jgi:hypothetical protein